MGRIEGEEAFFGACIFQSLFFMKKSREMSLLFPFCGNPLVDHMFVTEKERNAPDSGDTNQRVDNSADN